MTLRKILIALIAICMGQIADADEPVEESKQVTNLNILMETMQSFAIAAEADGVEELDLSEAPVLRYSDQIVGDKNAAIPIGAVFVWERNGRPEVISAIHPSRNERLWVEFLSLLPQSLQATRNGQVEWRPTTAGVEFKPYRDAPTPAAVAPQRLIQMRSLVRALSASVADASNGRQELRLLSRPIVRYTDPKRGIVDGSVFVFARATNPEMLVVLEAHETEGKRHWMISPAQFTGRAGEMKFSDDTVWTHDRMSGMRDPAGPFFQMYATPNPIEE